MRLGIWTPLPHTIRPEPRMVEAIRDLKTRGPVEGGTAEGDKSYRFAADLLRRSEALGFDVTLIAARHLGPDLDAWTLASALATQTETMELMVAAHPGILAPQMVAKMGASLDRISGGRFSVNVVNGWYQDEFNIFGNGAWAETPEERYGRMDEFIQVMSGLWTQEPFSLQGKYYQVDKAALPLKPLQVPRPRIYAASRSPIGKEIVARHCDCWFVSDYSDYRRSAETLALVRTEVAEMNERAARHGRSLAYGMSAHVICAETFEEAERQAIELEAHGQTSRYNLTAAKALGPSLVGPPDLIAERLTRYEAAGVGLFLLHFHPMIEGMENFAERVGPSIASNLKR